ncbi:MAG: chitobiase/beta-hexosaminidase C-terminal domain-containing protein [Chitinivibrionales bacterium]
MFSNLEYIRVIVFMSVLTALSAVSTSQAQGIESRGGEWDDSTRVVVIWNEDTEGIGLPDSWPEHNNPGDPGHIGTNTKDFVLESFSLLNQDNIKVYSKSTQDWEGTTITSLKSEFGGKLPHVIVYINAGYEWDPNGSSMRPYNLLIEAADSGVGITAIGDDAAYDGHQIFPEMHAPGDLSEPPIQFDQYPGMMDATETDFSKPDDRLWITLDKEEDLWLPDGGLLYGIDRDTLYFKQYSEGERGQADADKWDVDTDQLNNYSFIGFQQGYSTNGRWDSEEQVTDHIIGDSTEYKTISAMQYQNRRAVVLSMQPQFLEDERAAHQLVYNSLFWASDAHMWQKLPTPVIVHPQNDSVASNDSITLRVPLRNTELYTLRYTTDGFTPPTQDSPEYTDPIPVDASKENMVIMAKAFPTNTENWLESDVMQKEIIIYEIFVEPPQASPDGCVFCETQSVELSTPTNDASIYWTTDQSSGFTGDNWNLYSDPVQAGENKEDTVVIKAVAVKGDMTSEVFVSAPYIRQKLSPPSISPATSAFYPETDVTISAGAEEYVYFTTEDTTFSESLWTPALQETTITLSSTATIRAITYKEGCLRSNQAQTTYTFSPPKPHVVSGCYRDMNGDGRIDHASLRLDSLALDKDIPDEIVFRSPFSSEVKSVTSQDISSPSPLLLEVSLTSQFGYSGRTSFDPDEYGHIKDTLYSASEFTLSDSVAPVIDTAVYSPGKSEEGNEKDPDTLVVTLTERLKSSNAMNIPEPYTFRDRATGAEYTFTLHSAETINSDNSIIRYLVSSSSPAGIYPSTNDTISIKPEAGIKDWNNNTQSIPGNRGALLGVKPKPMNLSVTVKNLYTRDDPSDVFDFKSNAINPPDFNSGILIRFSPNTASKQTGVVSDSITSIEITVYDAVGNLVNSAVYPGNDGNGSIKTVKYSDSDKIDIVWNGRNRNGRDVASGIYMLIIEPEYTGPEQSIQRNYMVGIK